MGPESVVHLCMCYTALAMRCFCLEYMGGNKCALQLCLHGCAFVANDGYCCEGNPTTQNSKLFFPVLC
jgi:hypothetical protein